MLTTACLCTCRFRSPLSHIVQPHCVCTPTTCAARRLILKPCPSLPAHHSRRATKPLSMPVMLSTCLHVIVPYNLNSVTCKIATSRGRYRKCADLLYQGSEALLTRITKFLKFIHQLAANQQQLSHSASRPVHELCCKQASHVLFDCIAHDCVHLLARTDSCLKYLFEDVERQPGFHHG